MTGADNVTVKSQGKGRLIKKILLSILLGLILFFVGLLWRLQHAPIGFSNLSRSVIGRLYMQPTGYISPFRTGAVGEATWDHMSVQWMYPHNQKSFIKSAAGVLEIKLQGVDLSTMVGTSVEHLGDASIRLHVIPLLWGRLSAEEIYVNDLSLSLFKTPQGKIKVWFPGLVLHKRDKMDDDAGLGIISLKGLQSVLASKVLVKMMSSNSPTATEQARVALNDLSLASTKKGQNLKVWQGNLDASLSFPGHQDAAILKASSSVVGDNAATWTGDFSMEHPELLSVVVPELNAIQFPVNLHVDNVSTECSPFEACQLRANLRLGRGKFLQPVVDPLQIAAADTIATVGWKTGFRDLVVRVQDLNIHLLDRFNTPRNFHGTGGVSIDNPIKPKVADVDVDAFSPELNFETLGSVWPYQFLKAVRLWLDQNMTHGIAHNVHVVTHLHTTTGMDDLVPYKLEGDIQGTDLTVHWLRPIAPLEHASAHAHFLSPDALQVDASDADVTTAPGHTVRAPSGTIIIRGLNMHRQWADINVNLNGKLATGLDILANPKLSILSKFRPLPYKDPTGNFAGKLELSLPLADGSTIDQIWIDAHAKLINCGIDWNVIGPIRELNGSTHITTQHIESEGKGLVRGFPFNVKLEDNSNLTSDGQIMRRLHLDTNLRHNDLKQFSLGFDPIKSGVVKASVDWLQIFHADDPITAEVKIATNLNDADLDSPVWHKEAGVEASLGGAVQVVGNSITGLEKIYAKGPDLDIQGRGIVEQGELRGFDANQIHIGKNDGEAHLHWPGIKLALAIPEVKNKHKVEAPEVETAVQEPGLWRLDVIAKTLDISPFYREWIGKSPSPKEPIKTQIKSPTAKPWVVGKKWLVDIKSQNVIVDENKGMEDIYIHSAGNGLKVHDATLKIKSPYKAELSLSPDKITSVEQLHVNINALGSWLHWIKDSIPLSGGDFILDGDFNNPQTKAQLSKKAVRKAAIKPLAPHLLIDSFGLNHFNGNAEINNLSWLKTPTLVNALLLLDPARWAGKLDRIVDIKAKSKIKLEDDAVKFIEGQGGNDLIGVSFNGGISNLEVKPFIAIHGAISPFYYLNGSLGDMGGHKGEGILAATYHIKGDLSGAHVHVNPMTMFLPGVLRRMVGG